MNELGSYLKVWESDGTNCTIMPTDKHAIDAAVQAWLDTGRDSLVYLSQINGDEYITLASRITSWRVVTPEGRRKQIELDAMSKDEDKTLKAEYGVPWEDS